MKLKRIIALSGVALLVLLYIVTFISAIFTSEAAPGPFKACVMATFAIPVFLYAYLLIYKLTKERSERAKKELEEAIRNSDEDSDECVKSPDFDTSGESVEPSPAIIAHDLEHDEIDGEGSDSCDDE